MGFFTTKNSFLRAARRGDLATVQECLAAKEKDRAAYMAAVDEHGNSALHLAATGGNTDVLEKLLDAGMSVNGRTPGGETALHLSATSYSRSDAVMQLLLRKGADIDASDNGGRTALHHAATNHLGDVFVRALLQAGAVPDARSLQLAADRNEESMIALVEKGAKPEAADNYGRTAFHIAVSRNYARAVDLMLEAGADINARDTYHGYTPLHWAISNGHTLMAEKLMNHGADLNLRDSHGKNALQYAQDRSCGAIVQMIEARTAPPPMAAAVKDDGEQWLLLGEDRVAYIGSFPAIGRRLTEIFNFAGRERVSISENLKTGQENSSAPQSFDTLPEATLQRAIEAYKSLGGKPDPARVFGSKTGLKV